MKKQVIYNIPMTRGIFIAGNDSTLSRAIEAEAVKRVEQYTVALIPNRFTDSQKAAVQESEQRLVLDWNPSSPISARTLVLAAENRMERIDEAILVCSPPAIHSSAAELPLADVEVMANDHIKGWFYLIKELAITFNKNQKGSLILVFPEVQNTGKDEAAALLGPSALSSFRALCNGLLSAAVNEPYITAGFTCTDNGNEAGFASYIFKTIDEVNKRSIGKLHKFGRFNLFK